MKAGNIVSMTNDEEPTQAPQTIDRNKVVLGAAATGAVLLLLTFGLVSIGGDLTDARDEVQTQASEIETQASEIETLDDQVGKLSGVNDDLDIKVTDLESSLESARDERDDAEERAQACESLPQDVYLLIEWVTEYMDWATLVRTNPAAAVAQGDGLLDDQERVLAALAESVIDCGGGSPLTT